MTSVHYTTAEAKQIIAIMHKEMRWTARENNAYAHGLWCGLHGWPLALQYSTHPLLQVQYERGYAKATKILGEASEE